MNFDETQYKEPKSLARTFGSLTSISLVNRVKTNDDQAWESLVRLYRPLVCSWCNRAGLGNDETDDLVQDVFRSVFSNIHAFQKSPEQGSFRGWLWTISRNKIRDFYKTRIGKPSARGGTDAQIHLQHLPEHEPPIADTEFGQPHGLIFEALKLVREEIQEHTFNAFWRSTIDDIAPDVVAQELGISVDSVYQAKSRVLRRLRDLLE